MNTIDWKNATPEQINFWNLSKGLIAWNTITPLYYQGVIAGSEFETFNAAKLYICLEAQFGCNVFEVAVCQIATYNMANANIARFYNLAGYWSGAAAVIQVNKLDLKNLYFSRVATVGYIYMTFNGYKLTIV